jgi:hypothetical protein
MNAPVDRLKTLVDEALLEEFVEALKNARLVLKRHRFVRIVPAPKDANALELAALQVDILLRILAARLADGKWVHLELLAAQLLIDFDLDREAVAVPARDIWRVET